MTHSHVPRSVDARIDRIHELDHIAQVIQPFRCMSVLVLCAIGPACGARTDVDTSCQVPLPPAETAETLEKTCGIATCTLETRDQADRAIRLNCDGKTCQLFINEKFVCGCSNLDYSNTCSNGVPTCLTGQAFNFSRYRHEPCGS